MFFSRLAIIVAVAMLLLGGICVVLGTAAEFGVLDEATRARFIVRPPDQIIYGGFSSVLAAVVLGTLAEMSMSVRKWIP
jgi:hypothetical protein